MNKKLFLIFHGRLPSEKAASLFAVKNAEAFAEKGLEVILLVPKRKGIIGEDPYKYYSVKNSFKIVYIPTIDLFCCLNRYGIAFWLSYLVFSLKIKSYLCNFSDVEDIIYSNEILPLAFASKIRRNCFYEMHDFPESKIGFFGKYLTKMRWVLIHNKWKLEEAKKLFPNIFQSKYLYEPNAVDLNDFDIALSKDEARSKLSLPSNKKIIVYTGHLYGWKGVDTLAESVKFLPKDYLVIFVGGTDQDIKKFKDKYNTISTVKIVGRVDHKEVPIWQKASDILVLPNTAKEKISAFYTSPMKLFEYMASNRPIVTTDIPSIREILNDKNSFIVPADDDKKMAEKIIEAVVSVDKANILAKQAMSDVREHTWLKRAERIIEFMRSK